jgi:hypothetical protein
MYLNQATPPVRTSGATIYSSRKTSTNLKNRHGIPSRRVLRDPVRFQVACPPAMFEVTADEIALLSDSSLRELIGKLCEAEADRKGLPSRYITWGGDQDASDGGLDVRVEFPISTLIDGFVPRPLTGFQVKKADMPRSKISAEMKPDGTIRPVIREIAKNHGAYIIVTAAGSTSDAALKDRRNAMAEAVVDLPNREALTLDFYDRNRVATWVREHSGLGLWLKDKIGKSLTGWRPYEAWAYPAEGAAGEYLVDEALRVRTGKKEQDGGISAVEGITRIPRDSAKTKGSGTSRRPFWPWKDPISTSAVR